MKTSLQDIKATVDYVESFSEAICEIYTGLVNMHLSDRTTYSDEGIIKIDKLMCKIDIWESSMSEHVNEDSEDEEYLNLINTLTRTTWFTLYSLKHAMKTQNPTSVLNSEKICLDSLKTLMKELFAWEDRLFNLEIKERYLH